MKKIRVKNKKEPEISNYGTDTKNDASAERDTFTYGKNAAKSTDAKLAKRKRVKKALVITAIVLLLLPFVAGGIAVGGYKIWAANVALDKSLLPTASAVPAFYDRYGNELSYAGDSYVSPENIPDGIKDAFIALEDKRFYSHKGYDAKRMLGAVRNNLKAGKLKEGASTITQQLVKNTHLSQERTLERKLKEIAIAQKLEKEYSKDEILAMYLSVIYFGGGAYGVKQASELYFGKNIDELSTAECAMLAGIVKNPSKYSPSKNPAHAAERRNLVLSVMKNEGYLTQKQYDAAVNEELITAGNSNDGTLSATKRVKSAEYRQYLRQTAAEVCRTLGITDYQLNNSGYRIYTNLDTKLQSELAAQARNANNFEDGNVKNTVAVADNLDGGIIAYYSTLPYEVRRQAGSVLKPLAVYAPAIDRGLISLATPIVDEKVDFGGFSPSNYGGVYYGETTPRAAMAKSMNSVAVKVLDYVGAESAISYLNALGVKTSDGDKNYALALGSTLEGVTPTEMLGAYSALARGGCYAPCSYVRYITDGGDKILNNRSLNENLSGLTGRKAVSPETAALLTSALCSAVREGTAKGLSSLPFQIAAKTGTAERPDGKNSDAWNLSYTSAHTVAVWHGADEGVSEKGGGYPTKHAAAVWRCLYDDASYPCFTIPAGVTEMEIDTYSTRKNKLLTPATSNTPNEYRITELFASDNLPGAQGSYFENLHIPELNVSKDGKYAKVSFNTESIYDYEIVRVDARGERIIASFKGSDTAGEQYEYTDIPLSIGQPVEYTLSCRLKRADGSAPLCGSVTKHVFFDDTDYWS